jgi:hypothetical protein
VSAYVSIRQVSQHTSEDAVYLEKLEARMSVRIRDDYMCPHATTYVSLYLEKLEARMSVQEYCKALFPVRASHELIISVAKHVEQPHLWLLMTDVRLPPLFFFVVFF